MTNIEKKLHELNFYLRRTVKYYQSNDYISYVEEVYEYRGKADEHPGFMNLSIEIRTYDIAGKMKEWTVNPVTRSVLSNNTLHFQKFVIETNARAVEAMGEVVAALNSIESPWKEVEDDGLQIHD